MLDEKEGRTMDARTLDQKMHYIGMEKSVRQILIKEKLATVNEIAMMTSLEVCAKLLETYEVVNCDSEGGEITIVEQDDMAIYNSIVKFLSR